MCQYCVSEGFLTQEELDARVYEGDMTVMPIIDRIEAGQGGQVLQEMEERIGATLMFLLFGIAPDGEGERE